VKVSSSGRYLSTFQEFQIGGGGGAFHVFRSASGKFRRRVFRGPLANVSGTTNGATDRWGRLPYIYIYVICSH